MKLAVITSHPISYQVCIWRALKNCHDIDITVLYASHSGAHPYYDPLFGQTVRWDVDLLDGYTWRLLDNKPLAWINWRLKLRCPSIGAVLAEEQPDAMLLVGKEHWYYQQALRAARKRRIPILYRAETPPAKSRSLEIHLANLHRRRMYRQLDAFLCIGRSQYDFYEEYGVSRDKMYWAPYCVDDAFFKAERAKWSPLRERIRSDLGFHKSDRVVAFVGKFISAKRPMDLIRSFETIHKKGPYGLLMAGTGQMLDECQQYIVSHGIKNARLVGFKNQTEIGAIYAAADCFALPSQSEPWGLVVNEAMHYGLPVIASDRVGCAGDLVRDKENGFIYPVGDIDALSSRIQELFEDAQQRRIMGLRSEEIVAEYSVQKCVSGILESLRRIQSKGHSSKDLSS